MFTVDDEKPIIACSTGLTSNTAIGIIRISGINILKEVDRFLSIDITKLKIRYAHFCKIIFGTIIYDEVVITFFKGPNSYNGEDVLEISVHGNQINIKRIIDLFVSNTNIRHAKPGEFTQRALRNKKLSLSQVEGLDLLLNASNIFSLDQGFSLLGGDLQSDFKDLYDSFLKHRSSLELGFDFLDDIGEEQFNILFKSSLDELNQKIRKLYKRVKNRGDKLIKPDIAIFGLPNSGKSSLFNIILDDQRAIVSDIAGTTRDFISEDIFIGNNIYSLLDTAGLRATEDIIESSGIELAKKKINSAFFSVLLINPFDKHFNNDFVSSLGVLDLIIFTHSDLKGFNAQKKLCIDLLISKGIKLKEYAPIEPTQNGPIEPTQNGPIEPTQNGPIEPTQNGPIEPTQNGPIEPAQNGPIEPAQNGPIEPVPFICLDLSRVNQSGIGVFESVIESKYLKLLKNDPIVIERHRDTVDSIYNQFANYYNLAGNETDMAIISSELNIVGHCISELIGIVSPDDVLQNIFSNFCIGK